jgi:hypothetical protein
MGVPLGVQSWRYFKESNSFKSINNYEIIKFEMPPSIFMRICMVDH